MNIYKFTETLITAKYAGLMHIIFKYLNLIVNLKYFRLMAIAIT
jgi:hypothetical protein